MPRVLLVDDDIAEISAVKRVLARAGHQALLATNASDALGTVGRTPPAAIVIASTCEGGEALRRLAADGVASALPMLVLGESADAPPGAAQIARPVDPSHLADRLAVALGAAPAPPLEPHPVARIAVDRRAAADALRARAEELRRGAVTSALPAAAFPAAPAQRRRAQPPPPPPEPELEAPARFGEEREAGEAADGGADLGLDLGLVAGHETPVSFGDEAPPAAETPVTFEEAPPPAPDAAYSFGLEDEEGGAARDPDGPGGVAPEAGYDTHAEADAALAELEAPTRGAAPAGLDLAQDPGLEALLRRAEQAEAAARAEEEARRADEEATARAAADEEARRAEEQRRRADEEARRAAEAEARAGRERAARETADRELQRLRRELEESRRAAEERARAVIEAARAEEEEQRRRAEAEEEQLRGAIQSARAEMEALRKRSGAEEEQLRAAIQSARAEMEALRKRGEEEARRRAEAEAEAARLAKDAEDARSALEAEREAVEAEAARRTEEAERRARQAEERAAEAERHADERVVEAERSAAERAAAVVPPPPLELPVYRPPADDPAPDPAQESARRRVAALRERGPAAPAAAPAPAVAVAVAVAPTAPPEEEPPRAPIRPPPPELRSGTLAEVPAPRLLALAARARLGGRIDVEGGAARSLYFDAGRIVGATSSAPTERVEEVALRLGLVTRDQHRIIAASAAPLATRRAAVLLLERGFLKPNELASLVRRRTEEVVFGVFGDAGARFRWSAAEVPPDESTALDRSALQLAVEGVRRRWLAPELEDVLGGDATLLAPAQNGPSPADLGLSGEDRRILALADGLRTLDELVAASPLDPLSTRQLLAALVLVDALGVRTFQAGRPAAAASAAIDLARVRDKLEQVRRADYFTVLGVGRLCTPHEVRDAHDRLRAEFDPRRFQGVREEGLEARLEEILRVVEDARDVLADDFLRAEYLRGLGA